MIKIISVLVFICIPLAAIWAVNTLFGLKIEYKFETWVASLILLLLITGDKISES